VVEGHELHGHQQSVAWPTASHLPGFEDLKSDFFGGSMFFLLRYVIHKAQKFTDPQKTDMAKWKIQRIFNRRHINSFICSYFHCHSIVFSKLTRAIFSGFFLAVNNAGVEEKKLGVGKKKHTSPSWEFVTFFDGNLCLFPR